jgi:hypothetical protein
VSWYGLTGECEGGCGAPRPNDGVRCETCRWWYALCVSVRKATERGRAKNRTHVLRFWNDHRLRRCTCFECVMYRMERPRLMAIAERVRVMESSQ